MAMWLSLRQPLLNCKVGSLLYRRSEARCGAAPHRREPACSDLASLAETVNQQQAKEKKDKDAAPAKAAPQDRLPSERYLAGLASRLEMKDGPSTQIEQERSNDMLTRNILLGGKASGVFQCPPLLPLTRLMDGGPLQSCCSPHLLGAGCAGRCVSSCEWCNLRFLVSSLGGEDRVGSHPQQLLIKLVTFSRHHFF